VNIFVLFIRRRITGTVTTIQARRSGIGIPILAKTFLRKVQTGSGAKPDSYYVGTGVIPWGKVVGAEGDHSPPSISKIKNEWSYTSILLRCG